MTLYELTKLDAHDFAAMLKADVIRPEMQRGDIKRWTNEQRRAKRKRHAAPSSGDRYQLFNEPCVNVLSRPQVAGLGPPGAALGGKLLCTAF
ncbi:hypothetical protein SAMN05519104_4331 [Rhizobiales bacterium GAS188]|nr:hypothetical protein SAMN05519104_4331 [Rhizobiales bacterium GAS188]